MPSKAPVANAGTTTGYANCVAFTRAPHMLYGIVLLQAAPLVYPVCQLETHYVAAARENALMLHFGAVEWRAH